MRGLRTRGFALILVISIIGLMGITLGYLGYSCRLMLAEADRVHVKAVDRNLLLSGLTWASLNLKAEDRRQRSEGKGETGSLDANDIAGSGVQLSVMIEDVNDNTAMVRVRIYVPSAWHEANRSRTFRITQAPAIFSK